MSQPIDPMQSREGISNSQVLFAANISWETHISIICSYAFSPNMKPLGTGWCSSKQNSIGWLINYKAEVPTLSANIS